MKKILLIPFVFLSVISCKQERKAEVPLIVVSEPDPQVVELENQLDQLQQQLVEEQNLRFRKNSEQTTLLSEMKGLLKEMVSLKKEKPDEVVAIVTTKLDEIDEYVEVRRISRLQAQGEELAWLRTVSGAEYQDLVISRVTDIGVVFRHRGGVARVSFSDLSVAWQERFYYDEELALLARKKERLAQLRLERSAVGSSQQEQNDLDSLSLARLAEAVEDLNRGGGGQEAVVRKRIFIDPPVIVNRNHDYNDDVYCPPIVRPQIIRTPPKTIQSKPIGDVHTTLRPKPAPTVRPTPVRPTVQPQRPTPVRPTPVRPTTVRPAVVKPSPVTPRPTPIRPTPMRR